MDPAKVLFAREMFLLLYNREGWAPFYKNFVMVFRAIFVQIIYRSVVGRGLFRVWQVEAGYSGTLCLAISLTTYSPKL